MNYQIEYQTKKEKQIREQLERAIKTWGNIGIMTKSGIAIMGVEYELQYPYLIIRSRDKTAEITLHINQIDFIL